MGRRGTDVARGAATLVLLDDDFSTIVAAIRDGRRIFENLRRAFSYLIAFHAPLLLSAIVVPVAGAPILLLPVHLVWLEILLHPTVALVFEADPPTPRLMHRPPRRRSVGLVRREQLVTLLARGLSLTVAVLALYLGALGLGHRENSARGLALIALIVGQLLLVLVERSDSLHVWHRLSDNRVFPGSSVHSRVADRGGGRARCSVAYPRDVAFPRRLGAGDRGRLGRDAMGRDREDGHPERGGRDDRPLGVRHGTHP